MKPLDVTCPTCGQPPRALCIAMDAGQPHISTIPHTARVAMATPIIPLEPEDPTDGLFSLHEKFTVEVDEDDLREIIRLYKWAREQYGMTANDTTRLIERLEQALND